MTLAMNMRPVRLAATGKHVCDLPYCYRDSIQLGDLSLSQARDGYVYFVNRPPTYAECEQLAVMIKELNDQQEKIWNVNQPL